jgi:hypothetical protein
MELIRPVFSHEVEYHTLSAMSSREIIDSGHSIRDCLPLTHIMPSSVGDRQAANTILLLGMQLE